MTDVPSPPPVSVRQVLVDSIRLWRGHVVYLTTIAAILWLPLALLELLEISHGIEIDTDNFRTGDVLLNVAIVLVFELLTAEILAAAAEKIVAADLHGTALPNRREFLTRVPWGSLVLATIVYEVGVGIGLVFLVIPGLVLTVWGVVTGPVVVAEGSRALHAPGRSRELVRGSFRPVAVLVLIGFVIGELITSAAGEVLGALPHEWVEPAGEYVLHVATSPLFGMATAVLYYALLQRERARTRDEPAEAGPST